MAARARMVSRSAGSRSQRILRGLVAVERAGAQREAAPTPAVIMALPAAAKNSQEGFRRDARADGWGTSSTDDVRALAVVELACPSGTGGIRARGRSRR